MGPLVSPIHEARSMNPWLFRTGRMLVLALAVALGSLPIHAQQELRTEAEESLFDSFTSHDGMMTYLHAMQAASPDMRLASYGKSWEGRDLPFAIFARPMITQPWEAIASGKPIILFQTNVHGGERTQRESVLILMRELATQGTEMNAYLDDIVLLVVPQINPDGFEARPRATRGNAWGIDLNRDYIKLEQPEIRNLVTNLYHRWYPHVIVDGHNGGARPYNMMYITASNASVNQAIMDLNNFELFQHLRERNEEAGLKAFWYPRGNAEFWSNAPHYPRIGMTYASFMNSLGMTFESPGQPLATGVQSGVITYGAVIEYVVNNSEKVISTVENARRETIEMGLTPGLDVMVDMRQVDHDFTVSYEIPDPDNQGEFITIENATLRTKPEVTRSRERPWAYVLPRDALDAVAFLRQHNITVEVLREPATVDLQAYTLADISYRREYNHEGAVRVEVGEVLDIERTLPRGTFIVPTAQVMGRLVAHLLEPETDDNVVLWGRMNQLLPTARLQAAAGGARGAGGDPPPPALIPIFKIMEQTPLPTELLFDHGPVPTHRQPLGIGR
jgi:dipeptidyl-peptidase 4